MADFTGSNVAQENTSTSGVIIQNTAMSAYNVEVVNQSSTGRITTIFAGENVQVVNQSSIGGVQSVFFGGSTTSYNRSSSGSIISLVADTGEFTWYPDEEHSFNAKPIASQTKFGDGYTLRTTTALNDVDETWDLDFTRNLEEMIPLRNFLLAKGAVNSFIWKNPNGEIGEYIARSWSETKIGTSLIKMTVKFERVVEKEVALYG